MEHQGFTVWFTGLSGAGKTTLGNLLQQELKARDPKGLYEKALRGEIQHFTGVDDPYERPEHPDLRLQTGEEPPAASLRRILELLGARGYVPTR